MPALADPPATSSFHSLVPLTADKIQSVAELKDLAFAEKRGCCSTSQEVQSAVQKSYEKYHEKHPDKLQHCCIVVDDETGHVLGACQLQLPGDPADLSMDSCLRHDLQPGEAYVEFIATHPDHTGKGIGSQLLKWAFHYCQADGRIHVLTLHVMTRNDGAFRLYERKGFVVKQDPLVKNVCDEICTVGAVYFCMGCKYCSVIYMERPIDRSPPGQSKKIEMKASVVTPEEMKRD